MAGEKGRNEEKKKASAREKESHINQMSVKLSKNK